jgi:oxygen-independent coproporphyrinogen-3 oxidase
MEAVQADELPIFRGHLLSEQEVIVRQHILDIMCQFYTQFAPDYFEDWSEERMQQIEELVADGIIAFESNKLKRQSKRESLYQKYMHGI